MASNDQWPPVSSAASAKASAKTNGGNKRHTMKDEQQEILEKLNEMFGSTLEPGVILSVVINCNWNMQASIEGLITLGETVEDLPIANESAFKVENFGVFEDREGTKKSDEKKVIEDSGSVQSPWEEVARGKTWGKPRKSGGKNRMDSFCGNIAKLKSSGEKFGESGKSPGKIKEKNESCNIPEADANSAGAHGFGATERVAHRDFSDNPVKSKTLSPGRAKKSVNSPVNRGNDTREKNCQRSHKSGSPEESKNSSDKKQNVARFDNKTNMRKNESESLCGLKVQYRLNGMSSSDEDNEDEDDDADVVIEDETSDYTINLTSAITSSVSQFLSPCTQAPPRGTKPEIHMISTPSPPSSPQRSIHDATFARIKSAIARGNKILVLLRGLPGSGKTTLAKSLVATTLGGDVASHVYSSDDFFVNLGRGVYRFDPSKLSEAHTFNRSRVAKAMKNGLTPVIVDNTNIEAWEMRPYAALAVDNGYIVEILEPNTPWARNPKQLAEKNSHNVTKTKISERALKFEIIPSGQKLLDKFGLKYSRHNDPHLRAEREQSKAPVPPPPPPPCMADLKSNWANDHKNNYVLTSHDIESMQNIDETRHKASNVEQQYSIDTARSSSNGETNLREASATYADGVFKDYLKELQDSDDDSFEIVDGGNETRTSFEQCVRDQPTSGSSSSNEIAKDIPSETNNDRNTKDAHSQQTLGAIGSERKFNHSTTTINMDDVGNEQIDNNVLSQCWDFTLVHGGLKLHSSHGHYVSVFRSKASNEAAKEKDAGTPQNENELQDNEELSKVEDIDCIRGSESNAEIYSDKDEGEACKKENLAEEISSENADEKTAADSGLDAEKPADETVEELTKCESELILTESENGDGTVPKITIIDAILNLLKSRDPVTSEEPPETKENEIIKNSEQDTATNEQDEEQTRESSPNQEETTNLINLDVVDSPPGQKNLVGGSNDLDDERKPKNHSTNPFRTGEMLTDNMNSISWKESPFPIDGTKIPAVPVVENKRKIVKADAETMTTLYDFNVAYVGGTSEPGYRELWGMSRSINEGTPISAETIEENRTSNVVTFDKSSMTGEIDILAGESDPSDLEKEKDSTNRLDDLIEMFPHYPSEYLKTLYEQECNCNFDWVVDVLLLADVPTLTIENYEKRASSPKLSKIDHEKFNQRSHSFSPKNRRNRVKDLRSFSLECVQDGGRENVCESPSKCCDEEDKTFEIFYNKALNEKSCPVPQSFDASRAASSCSIAAATTSSDEESSETIELDFGRDFINQLEKTCGNPDFVLPDEFKPVIKIKKSLVDELYGLWIESMDHQMKVLHARLDERMAKDEAMARAVSREESVKAKEPVVPNLEEIMNMEMALAKYHNELKGNIARETPNDMASRLTRQMLYELLPDLDKEMLSELLKAHGGNFKETCEIIEANIGRTISKSDSLKKQQSLLARVHEESKNLDTQEENSSSSTSPLIVVNPDIRTSVESDRYHYQDAIARGRESRMEAQTQASLRIENYNKAAEAYRKGLPEVAAYYSQMVKLHTENIKAAHANAAEEFLSAQTFTQNGEDTLDLHNLFVREALEAVDIFLDYQQKKLNRSTKRSLVFYVITGYGARSNNRLGRIKPAVTKKLTSKNIRFTEANPGCLKVTLNRRNGGSD